MPCSHTPATQQTHDKKQTKNKTTSLSDKPTQLHTGSIATKFKSWCGIMKSKRKMSEHSRVNEEWSVLFKKAIRESKKKKRFIRKKRKEEEKKKSADEEAIQHWQRLYYKRNDSDEDFCEFNRASINTPPGAWETLDQTRLW